MNSTAHIEVLRTNVRTREAASQIIKYLSSLYEGAQVSFDLMDVDRVLRIASNYPVDFRGVVVVVNSFGFQAEVLPDTIESISELKLKSQF